MTISSADFSIGKLSNYSVAEVQEYQTYFADRASKLSTLASAYLEEVSRLLDRTENSLSGIGRPKSCHAIAHEMAVDESRRAFACEVELDFRRL
jgi:hypothetical protein